MCVSLWGAGCGVGGADGAGVCMWERWEVVCLVEH